MSLPLFKGLLPKGRAFSITVSKRLRQFFAGLSDGLADPVCEMFDNVFDNVDPWRTDQLQMWEDQWSLPQSGLTETQRRARLAAAWSAVGGQSLRYIQDTLRGAGFDVYLHDWWVPGTEPQVGQYGAATPRNPLLYLRESQGSSDGEVSCGDELAECGEPFAECGNTLALTGYALVNKVLFSSPNYVSCGDEMAECGEYQGVVDSVVQYAVPSDPAYWPYFFYVGGQTFGTQATVDANRRDEFETLILKLKPRHTWAGVMVEYN